METIPYIVAGLCFVLAVAYKCQAVVLKSRLKSTQNWCGKLTRERDKLQGLIQELTEYLGVITEAQGRMAGETSDCQLAFEDRLKEILTDTTKENPTDTADAEWDRRHKAFADRVASSESAPLQRVGLDILAK